MRIEQLEVYHVSMPLVQPFTTAFGETRTVESILVRLQSDGLTGWGEAAPWGTPGYSGEWAGGAFQVVRDFLAPAVVGQTFATGDELQQRFAFIKGNPFAKAAVDLAWWDLHARARRQPLWQCLGGAGPEVQVGADLGVMDSVDQLLEAIAEAVDAGFERVKLKYRPGWDLDMLRRVRERFPQPRFHIDCNSAYTLADLPTLRPLDSLGLEMIEQPLMHDDLFDHAHLRRQIRTPICLDESLTSPGKLRKAIAMQACDWVNIKHGRVGGLTPALRMIEQARNAGLGIWLGGMLESAVGQSFAIAMASLDGVSYPSDIFPTARFYHEDLATEPVVLSRPSHIRAFDGPGIGCEPEADRLRACQVAYAQVGP